MKVHHITEKNYHEEVLSAEQPVLLDFWAPWCAPCRMLSPILDEVAKERPDVKVCKVNVDEEHELARKFKVVSIPTMVFMLGGMVEDKVVGVRPMRQFLEML